MSFLLHEYLKAYVAKEEWATVLKKTLESHLSKIFPDVVVYFDSCENRFIVNSRSHCDPSIDRSKLFSQVWYEAAYEIPFPNGEQHLTMWMPGCDSWNGFFLSDEEAEQVKDVLKRVLSWQVNE
jgi:hypothetical protein